MKWNQLRRPLSLLLALLFGLAAFSGCGRDGGDPDETQPTDSAQPSANQAVFKLAYAQSDPLNPFSAASILNQTLTPLLYDPLYRVDEAYNAVPLLASAAASQSGQTVSVPVRTDVTFSDGSRLTAADVTASFELARKAPSPYAKQLENVESAKAQGDTVVFQLKQPDPYAVNCLDFPIVKRGSAADASLPVGTGRYLYQMESGTATLTVNPNRADGRATPIATIELVNVSDASALNHTLEIGNISFLFDPLNNGTYQRISAGVKDVALSNLVFLGVNSKSRLLQNPKILKAVNLALDRDAIATTAYQGHALASASPFHPNWSVTQAMNPATAADTKAAVALLEEAGYTKVGSNGLRTDPSNKPIQLKLIVNKTNESGAENGFRLDAARAVSAQLLSAGIDAPVTELDWAAYQRAVETGGYDLYLGEIKLTNNMDLSPLLAQGGAAAYGIDTAGAVSTAYTQLRAGAVTPEAFLEAFAEAPPFLPLVYRCGIVAFSRALTGEIRPCAGDVFYHLDEWVW